MIQSGDVIIGAFEKSGLQGIERQDAAFRIVFEHLLNELFEFNVIAHGMVGFASTTATRAAHFYAENVV